MKKFGEFICKNKKLVIIVSCLLLVLSFVGMKFTKVNYDILVYLPDDIETIKGQDALVNDFNMGSYSITIIDNMSSKDVLKLEEDIKKVDGVNKVVSLYDVIGTSIPLEVFPNEIVDKVHQGDSDLLLITFDESTSNEKTIDAVREIRNITDDRVNQGGMSSMVLDTMNLSEQEIFVYIIIAVVLCILVLELSLDSYVVPFILLLNIGCAILFNLGSNVFLGDISYITKALVAVLQLGVTTDFSIFLYHSYEKKKVSYPDKESAMIDAIKETFVSVTGSSLTTIVGFIALCAMQLTLGKDLGIVMAKGVLLGVVTVLTLFPSLLLVFDKLIEKTKHKPIVPKFNKFNTFIVKHHIAIFIIFLLLFVPAYLANSKVEVYYKLDSSLPETLESVKTNKLLKENYNIVSPEIILVDRDLKNDKVVSMINEIRDMDGIDFVLSFSDLKKMGITESMISEDVIDIFENDKYQMILVNSVYDIATDELNNQVEDMNVIVKNYDKNAIVAGEGPLMKDLVEISNTDFNNVNTYSIVCIFIVLFFVLRSISLPFLLITVIEFAIFVNMGISYFEGVSLPFIAPIVLGTIQLGATIDYAILMTTNYLDKRRNGIDKDKAMIETMNYCGTSILISGMCFFTSTYGVGLYSEIEMIGSLCTLISRGAIISMLVVICVLPSVLLIFDKIILKTTLKGKESVKMKNNVKNVSKKVSVSLLVLTLLIATSPINIYASVKNETVYSKLNSDGSVKSVLVNEQLVNKNNDSVLSDYTELENILNINNDDKFEQNDKNLTWSANGSDIFYQGSTSKSLPVKLNITYMLDGEEKSIDEILGKKGNVSIVLKYINNDRHGYLYTPFVVTMGTIIDSGNNSNVTVNNGKVVSNGSKNVIVGLAAPGLYESLNLKELKGLDEITISYETSKFELPSIYSVVTPKLIESSDLEVFNKLDSISNNVNELQNNMDLLDNGALSLKDGSLKIKSGLENSISELKSDNSDALNEEQIREISNLAVAGVDEMYTDAYKQYIAEESWKNVKLGLENSTDNTVENYVKDSVSAAVIEYLTSVGEYEDYLKCLQGDANSCSVINNDRTLSLIKKAATTAASTSVSKSVDYIAEKVSKDVAVSISYTASSSTAKKVATDVSKNVANEVKKASMKEVSNSLNDLYNGISQLDSGINELSMNLTKFNVEGINKITSMYNSNVKTVATKIESLVQLGESYSSFAGKTDSDEGETKFVLVVDSKKVEDKKNIESEKNNKVTLWNRIKNLFK